MRAHHGDSHDAEYRHDLLQMHQLASPLWLWLGHDPAWSADHELVTGVLSTHVMAVDEMVKG